MEEITTQVELYSDVLRDTALIKFLRYDVEDQLFQYIGGLDLDEDEEDDDDERHSRTNGERRNARKESPRDRYIRKQNRQLHCMQSALFFDINGLELSSAYAKVLTIIFLILVLFEIYF